MDPKLWELAAIGVSQTGESSGHTAREWSEKHRLVAAINAGMFEGDQKTHLGYMLCRGHVYTRHANKYQSVAAFDPRDGKDVPRFHSRAPNLASAERTWSTVENLDSHKTGHYSPFSRNALRMSPPARAIRWKTDVLVR
jgi:hypothetical protein